MDDILNQILERRDDAFVQYDELRFNGSDDSYRKQGLILDSLTSLFSKAKEALGDYHLIHATEDLIIEPGVTKEIKTNINDILTFFIAPHASNNTTLEFTNKGIISTAGYLSFSLETDYENGNKIYVTNHVPQSVKDEHDICGYHYCNPTTTWCFSPGIYKIEKGSLIGVAGLAKKELLNKQDTTRKRTIE